MFRNGTRSRRSTRPATRSWRAEARCAKYPEGSEPEVYYDPSNPKDACLERVQEGTALALLVAGAFAAAGAALLLGRVPGG